MDAAMLEYIKNNTFLSHNDGISPIYNFLLFYLFFIIFGVIVLLLILFCCCLLKKNAKK